MRGSAMKKCAVGAMLFGGTLGVAGAAEAGLTWDAGDIYVTMFSGSNFVFVDTVGGGSVASGANTLVLSPLASTGFSVSATNPGAVNMLFGDFLIGFSLSETTTITLSGLAPAGNVNGNSLYITDAMSSYVFNISPVNAQYSNEVTLAAGNYRVGGYFSLPAGTSYSGTMLNFAVPAPGALALLGAAGLVRRRRRS
ncbi:MAG: hypothetical protein RLY21_179 [Planctomycetota bacterium]